MSFPDPPSVPTEERRGSGELNTKLFIREYYWCIATSSNPPYYHDILLYLRGILAWYKHGVVHCTILACNVLKNRTAREDYNDGKLVQ